MRSIQAFISTLILHELPSFFKILSSSLKHPHDKNCMCKFFQIWTSAISRRVPKWESWRERGWWLWKPATQTWLFDFCLGGFIQVKLMSKWVTVILQFKSILSGKQKPDSGLTKRFLLYQAMRINEVSSGWIANIKSQEDVWLKDRREGKEREYSMCVFCLCVCVCILHSQNISYHCFFTLFWVASPSYLVPCLLNKRNILREDIEVFCKEILSRKVRGTYYSRIVLNLLCLA